MAGHNKPDRHTIRLPDYDYRQPGAYFVTICTQDRTCIFGEVVNAKVRLSLAGQSAQRAWMRLPDHFENVDLDGFVVKPNHMHAILWIVGDEGRREDVLTQGTDVGLPHDRHGTESGSLGAIIQNYKSIVTRRIHSLRKVGIYEVWQRNYWERIIRNERELQAFRKYIIDNPARWELDELNGNRAVGA